LSKEKESQEALLRIKADSSGGELTVGKDFPDLVARVIPQKYQFRRRVDGTIGQQIVEKIRQGNNLDEAESAFAEDWLSEHAKKYLRLKAIGERAQVLTEEQRVPMLEGPAPKDADGAETSDDWVNKFREDASLVDDDLVREIYARVLSEEHRVPGVFSLRVLGVLRYLDHEAATAFGQLQKVLVNFEYVPKRTAMTDDILERVGFSRQKMLMLQDAGLIYSTAETQMQYKGKVVYFRLGGAAKLVSARRSDDAPLQGTIPAHILTPAGEQLARIGECEEDEQALETLLDWFKGHLASTELRIADLPSPDWSGPLGQLTWRPLNDKAVQRGEAT